MTISEIKYSLLRVRGEIYKVDDKTRAIRRAEYEEGEKEDLIKMTFEDRSHESIPIQSFNNYFRHLLDSNYPPITKLTKQKVKKTMIKNKEENPDVPKFLKENQVRKEIKSSRVNPPYIRIAKDKGEFIFSKELVNLLNGDDNIPLMFSVDKITNKAYFYQENNRKDSYVLKKRKTNGTYCFTNMNLKSKIKQGLKIKTDETLFFDVQKSSKDGFRFFKMVLRENKEDKK